jgi:hypothetical protein
MYITGALNGVQVDIKVYLVVDHVYIYKVRVYTLSLACR